jgi:VWFA-related protein
MVLVAVAQQPAGAPPQNGAAGADGVATFKTSTQLVIETVGVKDKSGKPIEGLTAKDFIVTEDGMPQTIAFFEYQKLPETPSAPITTNAPPIAAIPMPKLPRTQIAPERPGDVRYRDRRLLALYFDLVAMPIPDQLRALEAAQKFIRTQMTPADLIAIMIFDNGAVRVLQDFTDDRERLLSIVETLAVGEDENATVTDDSSADTGAAFGQNDSEFNIFFTDRELSALQTAATMLGKLNEKKSLIYFASGLRLNGANNQAQLHATTNAAIKAGVQFWSIDARADGRREQGLARWTGDVHRVIGHDRDDQPPEDPRHSMDARSRHRR